jgi:acetyl-CoA acetyltransferase family protein
VPEHQEGGTYVAGHRGEDGELVPGGTQDAEINATYNYGRLFAEALGYDTNFNGGWYPISATGGGDITVTVGTAIATYFAYCTGAGGCAVTAGNASGLNDGAAALLIASGRAASQYGLTPMARIVSSAAAGVEPRIMGMGPVPSTRLALSRAGLTLDQMDVIELNEAFAAQGLACLRELGVADDDARVNPNGGAIALGHPLGMSGARLALTAARELRRRNGRYALCTMCIGVGQGFAMIIERV